MVSGLAQPVNSLPGNNAIEIKGYKILPDRGYSIERIRTDNVLAFVQEDSLRPSQANKYWFKVEAINRSSYAQPCHFTVLPNIDNTLFYFNEDTNGWIAQREFVKKPALTKYTHHVNRADFRIEFVAVIS